MAETTQFGLIEAGGTKFMLGIADPSHRITARHRIPTTTPTEVLPAAIAWFREQGLHPAAIGIASFGPLNLDRASPGWGHVTRTPKPHWNDADLVGPFGSAFGCPVGLETDVNGAALAESRWGAGRGHNSLLYLTVGTGIGGGFVSSGRLLAGLSHPEMGHIRVPRHPLDSGFAGVCPYHGDCLEGLASGPAVIARWGKSLSELAVASADHPAADMIAWYLGQAVANFQAILQPARIVLGGGVMATPGLLASVRDHARQAGGGYFMGDAEDIVVAPGLDSDSGLLGALAVALACQTG
jgi:fructokinase